MTLSELTVAIAIATAFNSALVWLRSNARRRTEMRVRQTENAISLLKSHTEALDRFLSAPDAPQHLREFLLRWSYAMDNREKIRLVVDAARRTGTVESGKDFEQTDALRADLEEMERTHPTLARTFESVIRTGTFGALLRWPESADLFERAVAHVEAKPDFELGIAVATASHRGGFSPSVPTTVAAA